MFGYSFIRLYFMINMAYTIIMFLLLHNIIAKKLYNHHHRLTSRHLTNEEIQVSMNVFYIIGIFTGSIRLLKDMLNLFFDHKTCIWLHKIYDNKE